MRNVTTLETYTLPDGTTLYHKIHEKTKYKFYTTDNGRQVEYWQAELIIENAETQ